MPSQQPAGCRRYIFHPSASDMKIGVLALQGDFDAHRKRLERLGAEVVLVKKPEQLDDIDGLVIPGGESGTFLKLLGEAGFEKLKQFVSAKPTFGTCAGAILLASEVENPKQAGLGAIDIGIRRNAYGRQVDSSIRKGQRGQRSRCRPAGKSDGSDLPPRAFQRHTSASGFPRHGSQRKRRLAVSMKTS